MDTTTALETLGFQRNQRPSEQEIEKMYKKLAKKHHPDKPTGNKTTFQKILQAKEKLLEPSETPFENNLFTKQEDFFSDLYKDDEEENYFKTNFDNKNVHQDHIIPPIGSNVMIKGLKNQTIFNNQPGIVLEQTKGNKVRVQVRVVIETDTKNVEVV
jgi:hypothetical protein